MRFFRLMAITVLLLACVVLGTACAGAKGETGPQGPQGPQGIQGPAGTPGVGVEWVGQWDSGTLYAKYDGVGYQGSSYISKQNNNTNHLPTDTAWWDLWVAKGDTGTQGIQGIQGVQGAPGPNMIVAMGTIDTDGTVLVGYNITNCVWDAADGRYNITLAGISYDWHSYVTSITTPSYPESYFTWGYDMQTFDLWVAMHDSNGVKQQPFSFMVLECP